MPREEWRDNPEAVGGIRTEGGKLLGIVSFPVDVYHSLIPCLLAGHFKQLQVTARDLHYRRGMMDRTSLDPVETPQDEL